jgi:beta-mannosidase
LRGDRDLDADDWWFRGSFALPSPAGARRVLCLDGLATLAEVWVNGEHVLTSNNMFHAHEVDVTRLAGARCDIALLFRSVTRDLATRRPRARWRTRLVSHPQLRWIRTTLLGRIPSWSPPVAPVGPWRDVTIVDRDALDVRAVDVQPRLESGEGVLTARLEIAPLGGAEVLGATIHVGGREAPLSLEALPGGAARLVGELRIPDVAAWWPHTHGEPALHAARVDVRLPGRVESLDLGRVGFRAIRLSTRDGAFSLAVNDAEVFCRGACWTPLDIATLTASPAAYRETLVLARDAGMNMLRVGGTMIYEADAFYEA